ncbi:DUF2508 family protein [Paenibacillus sp. JTLBN-2024]|uniref:DUF2508 family protein n=1 Tax=Paenibacillus cookii TaxID=157839 RepID=A0ABQ4M2V3_9BACL|nr:DUF2508 family protein [Paenibacillus cookii]KHF32042.1 hypothetical protein CM49_05765 [Paenibacillus sp. P1XP2]GIO69865.1 hypothetical protein J21TS3_46860 [Paenibacillus cookii]
MAWFRNKNPKVPAWQLKQKQDEELAVFMDVRKAQREWEQARLFFEEAEGEEQIDYAIYMLEAAELKYQMHLRAAKRMGLNRIQLPAQQRAEAEA